MGMSGLTRVLGIWLEYDLVLCQWIGISCSFTSQVLCTSLLKTCLLMSLLPRQVVMMELEFHAVPLTSHPCVP